MKQGGGKDLQKGFEEPVTTELLSVPEELSRSNIDLFGGAFKVGPVHSLSLCPHGGTLPVALGFIANLSIEMPGKLTNQGRMI